MSLFSELLRRSKKRVALVLVQLLDTSHHQLTALHRGILDKVVEEVADDVGGENGDKAHLGGLNRLARVPHRLVVQGLEEQTNGMEEIDAKGVLGRLGEQEVFAEDAREEVGRAGYEADEHEEEVEARQAQVDNVLRLAVYARGEHAKSVGVEEHSDHAQRLLELETV